MKEGVALPVPAAGGALAEPSDRMSVYAAAAKSPATRRAYQADFRCFAAWCAKQGADPLQRAEAGEDAEKAKKRAALLVGQFLAAEADAGVKVSTITRRLAAIGHAYRLMELPAPGLHEAVRVTLQGIRKKLGAAVAQKAPATADRVQKMLATIPRNTLRGKRDRALLLFGFAGAFRRSELVALDVADLHHEPEGVRVMIRRSKVDQEGAGQEIAILRGTKLKPVAALETWLKAAGITEGPLFRNLDRHGNLGGRLSDRAVALLVKQCAEAAGLDSRKFAGHSLRAGFLTSAAAAGADLLRMMEVSRHRRVETARTYIRRANAFTKHAGAKFL